MGIRKQGERVKGTTRVSFGDRKLMSRLWVADKTSRYEKRRTTRQLNKKEKESLEQSPMHRANKGFQSFMKEARAPAKEFEVPEDGDDRVALETMSHMVWYELIHRHSDLQDDAHILELFVRDFLRDSKKSGTAKKISGSSSGSIPKCDEGFAASLFVEMGKEDTPDVDDDEECEQDAPFPTAKEVERLVRLTQSISAHDDASMPLLLGRRNMRLMHQYRRLAKRVNHSADSLTATSAQLLVGHLYHSSAATSDTQKSQEFAFSEPEAQRHDDEEEQTRNSKKRRRSDETAKFDYDEFDYDFDAGGLQSTDALWPLMDGSASSARLGFQPKQWVAVGDSVVNEIAQSRGDAGARSSSAYYSRSDLRKKRRRASSFSASAAMSSLDREDSSSGGASTVLGFGFEDEERHRRHLRSEQRRNNVAFSHSYEMERQQSAWTTCQRCREPVHTCDMVVRESIGIDNVACFHPACLTAVVEARTARKRQETLEDRENNAEVRSLTAIRAPQEEKDQIRFEVYEKGREGIVQYQRERQQFLSANKNPYTMTSSEQTSSTQERAQKNKRKNNTMDDLMRRILGSTK